MPFTTTGNKKKGGGLDDVSDDDDDHYDPNVPDDDATASDPAVSQAENWEEFWAAACKENARKAREAGADPSVETSASELPKCRHGQTLSRGIPQGVIRCYGCDKPTEPRLECCQCLEIFKQRAAAVAFDTWERAFWCSHQCYREHWDTHKHRHGPSKSAPTRLDGRGHEFEAAEGNGALWDAEKLRRHAFDDCTPIF